MFIWFLRLRQIQGLPKLLCLLLVLLLQFECIAQIKIFIEPTISKDGVIFSFIHPNQKVLSIKNVKNTVQVSVGEPAIVEISDIDVFNLVAQNLRLSSDKSILTFSLKPSVVAQNIDSSVNKIILMSLEQNSHKKSKLTEKTTKYLVTKKSDNTLMLNGVDKNALSAVFIHHQHLWIVVNRNLEYTSLLKLKDKIFSNFQEIPLKNNHNQSAFKVFRVKLNKQYRTAQVSYKNDNLLISVFKNKAIRNSTLNQILTPELLPNKNGITIAGNFGNAEFIEFKDPDSGTIIKVLASAHQRFCVAESMEILRFKLLRSLIGVAIDIYDDSVELIKNQNQISVVEHDFEHDKIVAKDMDSKVLQSMKEDIRSSNTLLPFVDKALDIINFVQNKDRLLLELATAPTNKAYEARNNLAKFYFKHGLYHESLSVLALNKELHEQEFNGDFVAQFQSAVLETLTGDFENSKLTHQSLLARVNPQYLAEIKLWINYNNFLAGSNSELMGFMRNIDGFVKNYSDDIYWSIAFAEIENALNKGAFDVAEKLFKSLRNPATKFVNSLSYYKADFYQKTGQINLSKQILNDLIKRSDDPFNVTRAVMALVKIQLDNKEINYKQAINMLQSVSFNWRGDTLEYNLLMQLASYYEIEKDYLNLLRTYKYVQGAFYNKLNNFFITSEMVKIFHTIFLNSANKNDDFESVALFYEFKDLIPIGNAGDEIVLAMIKKMIKLDLIDQAIELLEHQVKYRLKDQQRVDSADDLAVLLLLNHSSEKAIQILNESDKDNFKFHEYSKRLILRAKALIDLERYDEAFKCIESDASNDAKILKRECLFQSSKWARYIGEVEPDLLNSGAVLTSEQTQDFLRLAIAYHITGNQKGLELLNTKLQDDSSTLKKAVKLLLSSMQPVNYKDFDLNIDQMRSMLNGYKDQMITK